MGPFARLIAAAVVLALAELALAQPATRPSTSPAAAQPSAAILKEVDALIAQIGDDAWPVRRDAQDKLVEHGEDAYARLTGALKTAEDPETRRGLQSAISRIEANRNLSPSLITLHVKDANPRDVFQSVARQAHTEFRALPADLWTKRAWPAISIDVDRQPFWKVVKELSNKTGFVPRHGYGGMTFDAGAKNWLARPSVVVGSVLITAIESPPNGPRLPAINFLVCTEPTARVLQVRDFVELDEATDEEGNSLLPQGGLPEGARGGGSWGCPVSAWLSHAVRSGTRIRSLKASAHLVVQTGTESIELPATPGTANVTRTVAGHRYAVREMRKLGDGQYDVTLAVYSDGWPEETWAFLTTTLLQGRTPAQLADEKGRTYTCSGLLEMASKSDGEAAQVTYRYSRPDGDARPDAPARLIWELVSGVKHLNIPFEFHDLPVP